MKEKNWSKDAISFEEIELIGKKLGSYLTWKNGLPPDMWEIEVYELKNGKLYGGVRYMGMLEPMIEEMKKEILKEIKKNTKKI